MGSDRLPWYHEGLRFECTGCGKCCTGAPGYVWITEEEMANMAAFLEMPLDEFAKKYVRRCNNRYSLIEKKNEQGDYDCIFLKGKLCQVYDHRPTQCRTFPFWPENLKSEKSWKLAAKACEGINDDAPLIPREQIEKTLAANEK